MSARKLSPVIRIILIACGLMLVLVLFKPFWEITLDAPQYPEGLTLKIHVNKLSGQVDIINGLNHYIGMKEIHEKDFVEFKVLPYCVIFFIVAFILTGIILKRKLILALFITYLLFSVVAMYDFWRWEYDYGHNLNPEAAIKVPGMAYQPPLIGFKQLLNFGAYSIPDVGGWIFIGCGVLLAFCVFLAYKKKKKTPYSTVASAFIIASTIIFSSCSSGPVPITFGKDNCDFCKMTISDNRFGAELITNKGKCYKFDDVHCLLTFLKENKSMATTARNIYFTDFASNNNLLNSKDKIFFIKSPSLKSPMGGNVAVFANEGEMQAAMKNFNAEPTNWNALLNEGK